MADYLEKFIIEAGKIKFETPDGRKWQMRQPSPEEASNALSAYRLTQESVLQDDRLRSLTSETKLRREANARAATAQALYLVPLLLEDETGQPVFDVFDKASMAEFEATPVEILNVWLKIFWGPVTQAIKEAKKKSAAGRWNGSGSTESSDGGPGPSAMEPAA